MRVDISLFMVAEIAWSVHTAQYDACNRRRPQVVLFFLPYNMIAHGSTVLNIESQKWYSIMKIWLAIITIAKQLSSQIMT